MAWVDRSMQVVKSHQVIALYWSILGDIVDSDPWAGSRRNRFFWRESTWYVPGECWPYLRNDHWTHIWMNLDDAAGGDIESQRYWFESELTPVSVTHPQPHRTPPNEGWSILLSSLQSPQRGLILRHCGIVSYICTLASGQLIMMVDCHNTMNRWVS